MTEGPATRWQPYMTADEVWAALEQQDGMGDGDPVDFRQHQLQTAALLREQGADDEQRPELLMGTRPGPPEPGLPGHDLLQPLPVA
jgi:hypothetical protein